MGRNSPKIQQFHEIYIVRCSGESQHAHSRSQFEFVKDVLLLFTLLSRCFGSQNVIFPMTHKISVILAVQIPYLLTFLWNLIEPLLAILPEQFMQVVATVGIYPQ